MQKIITMAHGAGGRQTSELIDTVFRQYFENEYLTADDAAVVPGHEGRMAMTTDGFIISPQFFPGGNIGKLSVCGTVNDLACMGARPAYLTCSFIIEEGYPVDKLLIIAKSMAETARKTGAVLVAGDTKVAGKGQAGGCFITTTGVGFIEGGVSTSGKFAKPGDAIIVTGDIGRHGASILLARDDYGIDADIQSDCAPLWNDIHELLKAVPETHVIRDATRGGLGTVLYEIAHESGNGIFLNRESVPVSPAVEGVCSMLGLEPMYLACEGTMAVIVPDKDKEKALEVLHKGKHTAKAAVIGHVTEENEGRVVMESEIGALTYLPEPGNELLPRIC